MNLTFFSSSLKFSTYPNLKFSLDANLKSPGLMYDKGCNIIFSILVMQYPITAHFRSLSYLIHLINSILLEEPPNTLTTQRDLQNAWALFLHNIIWSYDRHKKYKRMKAAVFGLFGGTWRGQLKGCHMLNQQYNRKSLLAADTSGQICSAC